MGYSMISPWIPTLKKQVISRGFEFPKQPKGIPSPFLLQDPVLHKARDILLVANMSQGITEACYIRTIAISRHFFATGRHRTSPLLCHGVWYGLTGAPQPWTTAVDRARAPPPSPPRRHHGHSCPRSAASSVACSSISDAASTSSPSRSASPGPLLKSPEMKMREGEES